MTQLGQLSTLQDLRQVVVIIHRKHDNIDMMVMFLPDEEGRLTPVRWTTAGDQELYECGLHTVTDAIIPIMRIITGYGFERTKTLENKTTFERSDYMQSKKSKTHN